MIVTVKYKNSSSSNLIECEQIEKDVTEDRVIIECWTRDELIERVVLKDDAADVYISSEGKTVDAVHFKGAK